MIIRYLLGADYHTAYFFDGNAAEHIEKLRTIGAKHFTVWQIACSCEAGWRPDADGDLYPCDNCRLGHQYFAMHNPDKVYPF